MIYGKILTQSQRLALNDLRDELGWTSSQLDYLIACMAFESNLNPQAVNKTSKAVGLIQFMPSICKAYGTTSEKMLSLTFEQQLPYVAKHFQPYKRRVQTLSDMYMAILMPKYIGYDENSRIFKAPSIQYEQNKALDKDNNGYVTKKEATIYVYDRYQKGLELQAE